MTFGEVEAYCKGYETRLARTLILPRFTAGVLYAAHGGKGNITDFFPLITDKRAELISVEEYEEFKKRLGYGKTEA